MRGLGTEWTIMCQVPRARRATACLLLDAAETERCPTTIRLLDDRHGVAHEAALSGHGDKRLLGDNGASIVLACRGKASPHIKRMSKTESELLFVQAPRRTAVGAWCREPVAIEAVHVFAHRLEKLEGVDHIALLDFHLLGMGDKIVGHGFDLPHVIIGDIPCIASGRRMIAFRRCERGLIEQLVNADIAETAPEVVSELFYVVGTVDSTERKSRSVAGSHKDTRRPHHLAGAQNTQLPHQFAPCPEPVEFAHRDIERRADRSGRAGVLVFGLQAKRLVEAFTDLDGDIVGVLKNEWMI